MSGFSPFLPLFSSAATGLFTYQVDKARISPSGLFVHYCVSIRQLFNGNWMKAGSILQPHKRSDDQNSKVMGSFQMPQLFHGVSLLNALLGQGQSSIFSLQLLGQWPLRHSNTEKHFLTQLTSPLSVSYTKTKKKPQILPATCNPTRKAEGDQDK